MSKKQVILSNRRIQQYENYSENIAFFRRNPIIACEELLGIPLMDSQAWILQSSWNTPNVMWTCTRGWGKSFMIGVFAMLKALLYPNLDVYILSKTGNQAKETFKKIEDIAKGNITSIASANDIFLNEIYVPANSDGFIRDPASFRVQLMNGSTIYTLNSKPDSARGKRARLLIFDESSFIDNELIEATLPFISMDSSFQLSTEKGFNIEAENKKTPNQVIYASSAGDETSKHAILYKDYAKKMIIGDSNYFCADIPVTEPLEPYRRGKKLPTMMDVEAYETMMRNNPDKAMREYWNRFDADGGSSQIVRWADIRNNETFDLPVLASSKPDDHFVIAFDPAHGNNDNSIITGMNVKYDDKLGYYGEIVNCVNLLDPAMKRNLKFTDQTKVLRQTIVDYSTGDKLYYEGIGAVLIDAGAGGHGTSYADQLLEPWTDSNGIYRYGLIDKTHPKYKDEKGYANAKDIVRLIQPTRKKEMIEQFIILMKSGLIKFPREYNNTPDIAVSTADGLDIEYRVLSEDERIALMNIEILKSETTSIHQYGERFEIEKSKQSSVGDDRFDTLVMLSHYLHELRRDKQLSKNRKKHDPMDYFYHGKGGIRR